MLQGDKVTKRISEIKTDFTENKLDWLNILSGFKSMKLTAHISDFKMLKRCGYDFRFVLSLLIWVTTQKHETINSSLSRLYAMGVECGKDVYYRLKNNKNLCWRRILWRIAKAFLYETQKDKSELVQKPRCLIFDDTLLEKTGKKIEKIGKVHDHTDNKMKLGWKMSVALFWDGKSSIPLDFCLSSEKGKREEYPFGMREKDLRRQFSKTRMKDSAGKQRVAELVESKIMMVIKMFYMAIYHCVTMDYVLCDSWFTCDALISAVRSQNVHLIGMYKFLKKQFLYRGKMLNYKQINASIVGIKRCRRMKLQYKRADVQMDGMPVTLFFSRQGNRGDWKVILTTNTALSFVQTIEIYQIRWAIEVFFKESKQMLNLGKSQSHDFDGQIADTTISLITYILLAFRYRYDNYVSKGALFRAMNDENLRTTLDVRLWGLFLEIMNEICEALSMDINDLFEQVMRQPKTAMLIERMLAPPPSDAA
jgi:hypothetical protein